MEADTIRAVEKPPGFPEEPSFLALKDGYGYATTLTLGTKINKYEVIRKLGWARSSTVWLSIDTSAPETTYVVLKVLTRQATQRVVLGDSFEENVFRKVSADPNHPGFYYCLQLEGLLAYKHHVCFVTRVMGSSIESLLYKQPNERFPVRVVKRIVKQLLWALDYLHFSCGYVHTDIKSDNILVDIPDSSTPQIERYLLTNPAATYDQPGYLEGSSQPITTTKSQPLPNFGLDSSLRGLKVRLIDYSEALPMRLGQTRTEENRQAPFVRAPEVILGNPWSFSIDIWSVGCLVFELVTGYHLFGQKGTYSPKKHLQKMVEFLGPFPPQFLRYCKYRAEYFNADGTLIDAPNFDPISLEALLRSVDVDPEEVPDVARFLRLCLNLDHDERVSTISLLADDWIVDVDVAT